MLHASETYLAIDQAKLQHFKCNDRAMIRQICNIKREDVTTMVKKATAKNLQ